MSTTGKVDSTTVTAFHSCTWSSNNGGSMFKTGLPELVLFPVIGTTGVWGVRPRQPNGNLTIAQNVFNAVANGSPDSDGSFTDTSGALGTTGATYWLEDNGSGAAVAVAT